MVAGSGRPEPATASPSRLVTGIRWRRVLPGEEHQLGILRRWLTGLLPESPARDDLMIVTTELATNAVRHTASGQGGWFAVEITWLETVIRVAVADCGGPTEPVVIEDPAAEHGRGLLVVRGLSERTGVSGSQQGRLVWAEVRWDGPAPATAALAEARTTDPYVANGRHSFAPMPASEPDSRRRGS